MKGYAHAYLLCDVYANKGNIGQNFASLAVDITLSVAVLSMVLILSAFSVLNWKNSPDLYFLISWSRRFALTERYLQFIKQESLLTSEFANITISF